MLDHLLVLTDDVEATRRFYCDVLGFETGERPQLPFPGCWLALDGVVCLHVAERSAYEAHARTIGLSAAEGPVDHVAFRREDGYDELAARDDVVRNEVFGAFRQLFATDPNGLRIELNFP